MEPALGAGGAGHLPQPSEAELVQRAQAGDRAALELLLERHLPGVEAFVRVRVGRGFGGREGASDVVQSTVRDLLENQARFQHGGEAAFRHWIYATAARKIADKHAYHRAARRDQAREGTPAGGSAPRDGAADPEGGDPLAVLFARSATPTQRALAAELFERLDQAFRELSADEREAVLLARVAGLPRAEVAQALGRTENAARNLLHRALIKLSGALDGETSPPAGGAGQD